MTLQGWHLGSKFCALSRAGMHTHIQPYTFILGLCSHTMGSCLVAHLSWIMG